MPEFEIKMTRVSKFTGTMKVHAADQETAEDVAMEVLGLATHQRLVVLPNDQYVRISWDEDPDGACFTEIESIERS